MEIEKNNIEYSSRSYIELQKNGEVHYISTLSGIINGNPEYNYEENQWLVMSEKKAYQTIKVDKDDMKAKRHYVKTLLMDGRETKIWECGLCGKEFCFQSNLVHHIPIHTDVRNYQCKFCAKAFRKLSTLAQHKTIHINKRPFTCGSCQKSFKRISTLTSHQKIHLEEKRHICTYCNKGFHQKGNLRNHMYTHTNERPYKCDICNKGFNQKSNLVRHKASTHSCKTKCNLCYKKFNKESLYAAHMKTVHNTIVQFGSDKDKIAVQNPKCAIIDDTNNIICNLSISKASSTEPEKSIPQINAKNKENEILLIIKHAPTPAMTHLHEIGKIPFVLFYQVGEIDPKICMTVMKNEEYALVNPSKKTIANYHIQNAKDKLSHSFPFVATIVQRLDSEGNLKTILMPSGQSFQYYVESYEGANGMDVNEYYGGSSSNYNDTKNEESRTKMPNNNEKRAAYIAPRPSQKNKNSLEKLPKISPQVVIPPKIHMDNMHEILDSENPIEVLYLIDRSDKSPQFQPASIDNIEKPLITESIPKINDRTQNFSCANIEGNFIQDSFGSDDITSTTPIEPEVEVMNTEIQTVSEPQQMSLVPLLFRDWWDDFDRERPARLLDQHFGNALNRDELSSFLPTSLVRPAGYFRPWRQTLNRQNSGSSNISTDSDKVQVVLDVQQFTPNEITVRTIDNTVIVEGKHDEKMDEHGFISRHFVRKYVLPKDVIVADVSSALSSDGVLTITAPKKVSKDSNAERVVPIIQTGIPAAIKAASPGETNIKIEQAN